MRPGVTRTVTPEMASPVATGPMEFRSVTSEWGGHGFCDE